MMKSVNLFCFHLFSQQICNCILQHSFIFFLILALTAFCVSFPTHFCSVTPSMPPLWPLAQDWPWEQPALNIVVCWQQHGVMYMRPREAQLGDNALNSCQMSLLSAKRFSAFNLWILHYAVYFLFVDTDERGPGGMRQITRVENSNKVKRQVQWAGPPPPFLSCSPNWLFRIVKSHISLYVRCKFSVDIYRLSLHK